MPSADTPSPSASRTTWQRTLAPIKIGMTRAEAEKIMAPEYGVALVQDFWGSDQSGTYRLDAHWVVSVGYDYTGTKPSKSGDISEFYSPQNKVTSLPVLVREEERPPLLSISIKGDDRPQFQDAQGREVARVVEAAHAAGHFDGVALVSRRGQTIYAEGFGFADKGRSLPNTLDTQYRICSITKQFTALLVMQMVQSGLLRLDRPVTAYLPDFRADTGGRITLRNLLTHTSGLASVDDALPEKNGFPGFYQQADPKFADAAWVTRTYLQGDLKTKPGEKFSYNNSDYIVLQAILEKTSGLSYARLLQARILKPLGMAHTGLISKDAYAPGQAVGYAHDGGKSVAEPPIHLATFGAAGAMYSTARDLLRWNNALDQDTLLAKPYREIMWTADKFLGYVALGSWVYPGVIAGARKKPVLVERQGEIGAFHTLNLRSPEDGYSVIVLSNTDTADLSATYLQKGLAYDILKALYAPAPRMEKPPL